MIGRSKYAIIRRSKAYELDYRVIVFFESWSLHVISMKQSHVAKLRMIVSPTENPRVGGSIPPGGTK